ncbi:MAG: hypothetical protein ACRDY0_01005 [Acidimicrobiales bacterium]
MPAGEQATKTDGQAKTDGQGVTARGPLVSADLTTVVAVAVGIGLVGILVPPPSTGPARLRQAAQLREQAVRPGVPAVHAASLLTAGATNSGLAGRRWWTTGPSGCR